MKRILILTFLLFLCADCLAQDPVQVVRTYITTLNDALSSPNDMTRRRKIENLLGAGSPGIKDEIVEKYNTKSTSRMLSGPYLAIFYDLIQNSSTAWIKVSIIGTPTVIRDSRGVTKVYATLQYSGAISLKTSSEFWIDGSNITGIISDEVGIAELSRNGGNNPYPPKPTVPEGTPTSVVSSGGSSGSHQYVDLGIGTLWATCNVGAANPWDYGDYFAWGETDGKNKSKYDWSTLKYCEDKTGDKFSKYNTQSKYGKVDNKTVLDPSDDAATANWGSDWCMPTADERDALINKCYWVWTENYHGTKGYIVYKALKESDKGKRIYKGSTPDAAYSPDRVAHIFLPAAGYKGSDGKPSFVGSVGNYWSSSLSTDNPDNARYLYFNSSFLYPDIWFNRGYGFSVRPVRSKN